MKSKSVRSIWVVLPLLLSIFPFLSASDSVQAGARIKRNLTPKDVISAPRPSNLQSSPDGKLSLISSSTYNFTDKSTSSELLVFQLPEESSSSSSSITKPFPLIHNHSSPNFISRDEIIYLLTETHDDGFRTSTLHLKNVSSSLSQDPKDPGYRVGGFPTMIQNLKVIGASSQKEDSEKDQVELMFTADVYQDGKLESVREWESSEREKKWEKVKVYDTIPVRHWDTWINPHKSSQLFSVTLRRDAKGFNVIWSFVSNFKNLLESTSLEVPIPPFGGLDDFDGNQQTGMAVFVAKDLDVNAAWNTRTDVWLVSLKPNQNEDDGDGEGIRKISENGKNGAKSNPIFSGNGKWIFWLEMKRNGFESDKRMIRAFKIESGESFYLNEEWDSSPSKLVWEPQEDENGNGNGNGNGNLLLISTDDENEKVFRIELGENFGDAEEGLLNLKGVDKISSEPIELVSKGSVSSILPLKNGHFLISKSSMHGPDEAYLINSGSRNKEKKLTDFISWSQLSQVDFGPEPYQITYLGAEGREAHGWVLLPPSYSSKSSYPLAAIIHGGPEGSFSDSWSTRWNPAAFSAKGFVTVVLDPAGSTGFGQEYQEEIVGNWGGKPYFDIKAGVEYVLSTVKGVDRERVVAAGASYGGYMINWIQGHNIDGLFKALVCHDGVFNTLNTFYSTDELYFPEFEFGGTPWGEKAEYSKWSPSTFVSNWETPQLIIHGGKDFRLTESEGLSAFNTLQRRGVPSKLVYFPDENHWVLDPENSLVWHEEVLGWMMKYSGLNLGEIEMGEEKVESDETPKLVFQ